jgi:hypothetical protein
LNASVARCLWPAIALAVGACSGGSDGGGGTPVQVDVRVSGRVTFDFVPSLAGAGGGLDYANTAVRPARGVTVELISGNDQVVASTVSDPGGAYSFLTAPNEQVFLRAKAAMAKAGAQSWDFRVLDNTNGNALYALDGVPFNTGSVDLTGDLHAASGWDASTSSYANTRAAAPFAILDAVYDAVELVSAVDASLNFPALNIYWSPDNVADFDANGDFNPESGEIGSTFYASRFGIYLLGAADADTEEYDRHVIVHEWAHYFEDSFSRADNIGGPHSLGDQLDLRVAFGEGFGNAFSAMVTGDPVYRDTSGPRQSNAGGFDVEGVLLPAPAPGWFSERSVQEILYDLYDANQDSLEDNLALGFAPLYQVLTTQQLDSIALTSIFSFIHALKQALPADMSSIDAIVGTQSIEPVQDGYGTGETNSGSPSNADVLPIYYDLDVNAGPVSNVCSTNDFSAANTGAENKLGSRQYLKFNVSAPGTHVISARATFVPSGRSADPDLIVHQRGSIALSEGEPGAGCTPTTPLQCEEVLSVSLAAGDYVLEVYEWTNTEPEDSDTPPIGRTCFDVEVTR